MSGWGRIYLTMLVIFAVPGILFLVLSTMGKQPAFATYAAFFLTPVLLATEPKYRPSAIVRLGDFAAAWLVHWAAAFTAAGVAALVWHPEIKTGGDILAVIGIVVFFGWGPSLALVLFSWIAQGFRRKT